MRLSDKDRLLLSAVELSADLEASALRKITKLRDHSIRYALDKFKNAGIITLCPFIDVYRLGYVDYAIYFSLAPEGERAKEELLQYLIKSPEVSWLAILGGDYQYGISICSKELREVRSFLNKLSLLFPGLFFQKSLSVRLSLTLFSRKYLQTHHKNEQTVSFGYKNDQSTAIVIDEKDHAILSALEQNPSYSLKQHSDKLKIPITTLQYRLTQLRKEQVLVGMIYQVDASKFNMQCFRYLIEVRGINTELHARLFEFAKKHLRICYFIECLGNWDYELGAEVVRGEDAVRISQELYREFGNELLSVKILPVFGHGKIRNFPREAPATLEGKGRKAP